MDKIRGAGRDGGDERNKITGLEGFVAKCLKWGRVITVIECLVRSLNLYW